MSNLVWVECLIWSFKQGLQRRLRLLGEKKPWIWSCLFLSDIWYMETSCARDCGSGPHGTGAVASGWDLISCLRSGAAILGPVAYALLACLLALCGYGHWTLSLWIWTGPRSSSLVLGKKMAWKRETIVHLPISSFCFAKFISLALGWYIW